MKSIIVAAMEEAQGRTKQYREDWHGMVAQRDLARADLDKLRAAVRELRDEMDNTPVRIMEFSYFRDRLDAILKGVGK